MTILSDRALQLRLGADLCIVPLGPRAVQPSSVDLRLGPNLLVASPDGLFEHHLVDDGPIRMVQGRFVLGSTLEWIALPRDLAGTVAGRSSQARRGIQVESAGFVDPGWAGCLTLEIVMLSPWPTFLECGMPIAQIVLHRLDQPASTGYGDPRLGSRYRGARGPIASRPDRTGGKYETATSETEGSPTADVESSAPQHGLAGGRLAAPAAGRAGAAGLDLLARSRAWRERTAADRAAADVRPLPTTPGGSEP